MIEWAVINVCFLKMISKDVTGRVFWWSYLIWSCSQSNYKAKTNELPLGNFLFSLLDIIFMCLVFGLYSLDFIKVQHIKYMNISCTVWLIFTECTPANSDNFHPVSMKNITWSPEPASCALIGTTHPQNSNCYCDFHHCRLISLLYSNRYTSSVCTFGQWLLSLIIVCV